MQHLTFHKSKKTASTILIFTFAVFLSCIPAAADDAISLSASLSTTSLSLEDMASLTITVNGARSADVEIPEVDNLIFHRRGQSSRMQIINGSFSSSVTSTYVIQPLQQGIFTIPSIAVHVKSKTLTTEPLTLEVTGTAAQPHTSPKKNDGANPAEIAFLTLSGVKDHAYTGEILPVEIKAYFLEGVRAEVLELPKIRGEAFVISPLDSKPQQTTEHYRGRNYSVISWQSALSPIKEGDYDLAIDLDATLLLPQKRQRSRSNRHPLFGDDFFGDDFFDDFFGSYQKKKVSLASQIHPLSITALPEQGKPQDFSGAVGDFDFTVNASPVDLKVGDPITLTMTITGRGNFDRVSVPAFPEGPDWKTYSATSSFTSSGTEYQGKKVFEQAVVVNSPNISELPALHFSFFDPDKEQYINKTSSPLKLNIQAEKKPALLSSPPAAQQQTLPRSQNSLQQHQPVTVRLKTGTFVSEIKPVFSRKWFVGITVTCTLTLSVLLLLTIRRNYQQNNASVIQARRLQREIESKLNRLQQHIDANNRSGFLQECRQIIQARLGMVWKTEPSTITLADLQQRLPSSSPLIKIFSTAEQHAYGSFDMPSNDLNEEREMLEKALEDIT